MKVLAYIPARSGSKGVPDKNIKPIGGIPLLLFTVWCARQSDFADVLVSTDSERYLDIAGSGGVRTDYLRPAEFASDTSPTIDGMLHALDWYEERGTTFDAVMILQPTAPFRTPEHVAEAIRLMEAHPEATCVAGIRQLGDEHPARIKKWDGLWLSDFCGDVREPEPSRRQDFQPSAYLRNGTIYLTRTDVIRERHLVRGEKVIGMPMPEANSVNVDTHLEFVTAEACLNYPPYREDLRFFDALIASRGHGA